MYAPDLNYDWLQNIKYGGYKETESRREEFNKRTQSNSPQLAYMWEVSFNGNSHGDSEKVTLMAQSTGIPAIMTEPIKRRYAGVEYTYAGRNSSPKIYRLTVWDDQDLHAYKYFQSWINLTNDPDDGSRVVPSEYMREVVLKMLDASGESTNTTAEFKFSHAFPTEISEVSLSYEMSSMVTYDVLFSFNTRSNERA